MNIVYCNSVIGKIFLRVNEESIQNIKKAYPGIYNIIEKIPYSSSKEKNKETIKKIYNKYNN